MTVSEFDVQYMQRAIALAKEAEKRGEVPIGAVIVWEDGDCPEGRVVGEGYNARESEKNALLHAEIVAIDNACKTLGGWRLHKATLYVTVEPCVMCAGAIVNSRIKRVVYGAKDPKAGAFGTVLNLNDYPLNHKPEIFSGVREEECAALLSEFFKILRAKKSSDKKIRYAMSNNKEGEN